jgi:quercetin dioxygenase-like cupin family protein
MAQLPETLLPLVITPEQTRTIRAFGTDLMLHLDGKQTGNQFMLATVVTPPGGGPPPHCHTHEDECFILQEGRVSFLTDGQWREVDPGTVLFLPKGKVHTYKNIGDQPCRMLVSASPSGFEIFFARCAEEFNKPGGPDMQRILAISAEHGISYPE